MLLFINKVNPVRKHKNLNRYQSSYLIQLSNGVKNFILDILFPPICVNCQKPLDKNELTVCQECLLKIHLNTALFCPVCRARLAENKKTCHSKSQYLLAAAGDYDDPVLQNLIQSFKYKSVKTLAQILSDLLIKYSNNLNPKLYSAKSDISSEARYTLNPIIVPIPLYPRRERERGFNQSKLLAEDLSKKLNFEFCEALIRVKKTLPQAQSKDIEERIKNIEGCFKIKNSASVKDKSIILVDDVFTSGATMNEAIKILKQNGAKKILALVIAKA